MRRTVLSILIILCLSYFCLGNLGAQETDTELNLEQFDICYWRAEKDGKVSYLLGTLHLFSGEYLLPIEDKIINADTIIVEVETAPGMEEKLIQAAVLEPEEDLSDILSPQLYAETKSFYQQYKLPWEVFKEFKPWYLALNAQILSFAEVYGLKGTPMDIYVIQLAQNRKKTVVSLETVEEQIGILGSFSPEIQAEHLKYSISPEAKEEIVKLVNYYSNKNFVGIEDLIKDTRDSARLEVFYEKMIVERNERMNQKVLPYIEQGNIFVAVGLAHLLGDNGLINFLESEGYDIKLEIFRAQWSEESVR